MKRINILLATLLLVALNPAQGQSTDKNSDGIDDVTGNTLYSSAIKDTGDVLHSIPLPSRYCWALTWDGEALWSADYITKKFIKLDPQTGNELLSFSYPAVVKYIEGLAWDGEYLWATGWYESNGNGSHIFKIDPQTGEKLKDYFYPSDDPWPHGLAYDGEYLWSANYIYEGISTMDKISTSGNLVASYDIADNDYYGLTWDGNSLWVDDMDYHMLYEIRYPSGLVELEVTAPCWNPRDMAWDGEYLWVLSWETETIYQVNVGPAGTSEYHGSQFSVFPNPVTSNSVITLTPENSGLMKISLLNSMGEVIGQKSLMVSAEKMIDFPLNELYHSSNTAGMYFIKLEQGNFSMGQKVIF